MPPRHDAAAAVREPDRVARPCACSRAACAACRCARRGGRRSRAARAPPRRRDSSRAISRYSCASSRGRERVEAASSAAPPRRWRRPAPRSRGRPRRSRPRRAARTRGRRPPRSAARRGVSPRGRFGSAGRRSSRLLGLEPVGGHMSAEHRREHRVERRHLRLVGHEHRARGPVQPPARHRPDQLERLREARGALGGRAARRPRAGGG